MNMSELFKKAMNDLREDHRKEFNDVQWAQQQPEGEPKYKIGDVIRFQAGGIGVIYEVSGPRGGWPSSYSTRPIEGFKYHPRGKYAWHYEGDFSEWVAKSPLHSLNSLSDANCGQESE